MKQKLWILTELYYPDETATAYILTNIARTMTVKYDVHVICGPVTLNRSKVANNDTGITVHRTKLFNMNKNKLTHRTLRFVLISLIMFLKLIKSCNKEDKVFVVTNPAPLVPLVSFAKRLWKFELTILIHDLFPENVIPAGILKDNRSLLYRCLIKLFDKSYVQADKIIVLGRDMQEIVEKKLQRYNSKADIKIITNWADDAMFVVEDSSDMKQIEIQYAGNLGRVQGLLDFIELFKCVKNNNVKLSLWGTGGLAPSIQHYIEVNNLKNVEMNQSFPRKEQAMVLGACDLCLVTLAEGMYGLGVPSKTYNSMAAGKPILYIGPEGSEIWRMVYNNGIGFCFSPSDHKGIMNFIQSLTLSDKNELRLMGAKARSTALASYTKEYVLHQIFQYV